MQRELEALLSAFAEEQEREARLIQDIVGILREARSARQRTIESLANSVGRAMGAPSAHAGAGRSMSVEQVSEALEAFRAGSTGFKAH